VKTPKYPVTAEHVVNRSRFIGFLSRAESEIEASAFLDKIRADYPDATHHVYAYVLGDNKETQKASDDGEPVRTAGFPVLDVLNKNDVTDAIIVVVRYFGGIKLGSGGLIRAYSATTRKLLEIAEYAYKTPIEDYILHIGYAYTKPVERYLNSHAICIKTEYGEKITYRFSLANGKSDEITALFADMTNGEATLETAATRNVYL